jgi:branched-chain amino acid transport system substrate-binding protein
MKRSFSLLLAAVTLLSACQPGGSSTIKVGFIGPLTGDAAAYGVDTLNGAKLKVDELNKAGGINGKQVELIAEDSKCNGADAASAAQKLASIDKVVAVIGGACSSETLAAAPILEAAKIPALGTLSSSPAITDAGDFIFRDYPSDALKTKAMAAYFKSKGYTKVAIIAENTDFCTGFRDSLKKDFGTFVFDESVEPGTKDYRSLMTRLKAMDFDVLVADGQTPATIAVMIQQMRDQGLTQPAITHDAGQAAETITVGGQAVEGLQAINIPAIADTTDFGKKFVAAYGTPRGAIAFAGYAYDDVGVVAQAIASGAADGSAIRDYLYQLSSYPGVVGAFHFDKNGDVVGINYKLLEVQDGKWVELQDIAAQ